MPTVAAIVAGLVLLSTGADNTLSQYLSLRKKHGVTAGIEVDTLDTFVGAKVCEVRGLVKGTFQMGDTPSILLEKSDGDSVMVDAPNLPLWLAGSDIAARLLVSASRASEHAPLKATLLGAAPEEAVAQHEASLRPKAKAATSAKSISRRTTSRGSTPNRSWSLPASEVTPIYASFIKSRNRRLSDAEAMRIAQGIIGFSIKYGVDARLIMAMVMVESGFNPNATSRVGAMGLGQLMPGTAQGLGVRNAYDTVENLYGTVKLVRSHLDGYKKKTGEDFEALVLALAAYNAGPGAVKRHGGVPPYRETQNYVRKVIALYYAFLGKA